MPKMLCKLPWIIIAEALTEKDESAKPSLLGKVLGTLTGQKKPPKQSEFYSIMGVPTMLLVDKEGKIIMTGARGEALQTKLAEIFK